MTTTPKVLAEIVYDDGAGAMVLEVLVSRRFWASNIMRRIPYGARILEGPKLVRCRQNPAETQEEEETR